jgi:hypothetical protein
MTLAEVKSYAAVARFFGETTPDEDERAMRFFGVEANR